MNIVEVGQGSREFDAVLQLWRRESATLGFMPAGGFEDAARRRGLLAALDPGGEVAGYVMFRRTTQRACAIVHLCVDPERRGEGTARKLFDALKSRCHDCYEIRLLCRRDFEASRLWPKLGFVAVDEKRGRGREGILTIWRYELETLPLLRLLAQSAPAQPGAVRVVIDANVFFDLDDENPGADESQALVADWLSDFIELAVTEEIYNEIDRRGEQASRIRQRERARRFVQLPRDATREEAILPEVRKLLPQETSASTRSDARQIAKTIVSDVTYFVTRDQDVLAVADQLEQALGIEVMSPHEIVLKFDELRRAEDYRPRRLSLGPRATSRLAVAEDVERLVDLMHGGQPAPEPRRRTVARLREMLAQPERFRSIEIEKDGHLLAAYVLDRKDELSLSVPFFAVAASHLGRTAARHYSEALLATAAREGRRLVRVENAGARVGDALAELGFSLESEAWFKLALPLAFPPGEMANELEVVAAEHPAVAPLAKRVANELRSMTGPGIADARVAEVERALWPAKILSTGLPCFIVPIQPRWAKELFDTELALGTLFGANADLALNSENVYYRAARPAVVTAPSRVLWYVSDDGRFPESKAIRACSLIDEVVVGAPKELFRKFRRLGIYEWQDVFALAKRDLNRDVMAFRFSRTELFRRSVPWSVVQDTLEQHAGKRSQLQSPTTINEACFLSLYLKGTAADAA